VRNSGPQERGLLCYLLGKCKKVGLTQGGLRLGNKKKDCQAARRDLSFF
jgi:hypothetical protein